MHNVIRSLLEPGAQTVCVNHFDVSQPASAQFRTCNFRKTGLSLDSNHGSIRTDALGQQGHDTHWATADIHHSMPGADRDAIEHPASMVFKALHLGQEPLLFCESAA